MDLKSIFKTAAGLGVTLSLLTPSAFAEDKIALLGAGATFPAPIYQKWFDSFNKENPKVEITYNPIGSGGGIKNMKEQTVDFGASDAPLSDEELASMPKKVLHIPTVLGAVVLTQNLAGVKDPLNLTGDVIAQIYMGKITKWNDPKITGLNKKANLPDQDIVVVYRADSSGTTNIFTEFLSKTSLEWKKTVGQGKSVKWPVGQGNKGNDGVASVVKNTPGAIGYVELVYAIQQKMPQDSVQNVAGKFVKPDLASVSAAAAGAVAKMPDDFRVSITNADGAGSYPISAFTYLLVFEEMAKPKGEQIYKLLEWAMNKGQEQAPSLTYAPLPKPILAKVKSKIKTIKVK